MYIKKIELTNIRCFKKQIIKFNQKGSTIVISGDNGDGKSTLLRSIAMGLTDETSAAALLRELPGDFVRSGADKGIISIILGKNGISYEIKTTIFSLQEFEKVEQELFKYNNQKRKKIKKIEDFPWGEIFVSGYGAGIRTNGTADYQHYTSVDAVYPLFRYDVPLQNPELGIRRIVEAARKKIKKNATKSQEFASEMEKHLMDLLGDLLNLNKNEKIKLTNKGIEVDTKKWGNNELGAMGDGYKATITWVMDLLSWWMLFLGLSPRKNIYYHRDIVGIVIVDELEQHLHPRWQKIIIKSLRKKFPKIQFIITSHSPLVISGAEDTNIFIHRNSEFIQSDAEGWLAEDVYRDIMGISTSRPGFIQDKIDRYKSLQLKSFKGVLSINERSEMNRIKLQLLRSLPASDPVVLTSQLQALSSKIIK